MLPVTAICSKIHKQYGEIFHRCHFAIITCIEVNKFWLSKINAWFLKFSSNNFQVMLHVEAQEKCIRMSGG